MPNSVLEAIKLGIWDFEPKVVERNRYDSTKALPGTGDKIGVLADRVRQGLPLWHPDDCRSYEEQDG